jgi:hypothetical protein
MSETRSMQPEHQSVLPQFTWGEIHEPGAYVELGTGDLYRIPKEALIAGASPAVVKESRGGSRLAQVSKNPFCTILEARLQAARHNIEPNF